jgi:hypothetical protein
VSGWMLAWPGPATLTSWGRAKPAPQRSTTLYDTARLTFLFGSNRDISILHRQRSIEVMERNAAREVTPRSGRLSRQVLPGVVGEKLELVAVGHPELLLAGLAGVVADRTDRAALLAQDMTAVGTGDAERQPIEFA